MIAVLGPTQKDGEAQGPDHIPGIKHTDTTAHFIARNENSGGDRLVLSCRPKVVPHP